MTSIRRTLGLLSRTLTLRGALTFMLGVSAVVWTEPFLILALLGVGGVAAVLGLFEVGIAFAMRRRERRWLLVLAHGSASMAFGLLTLGAAAVPLRAALSLTATWLLVYAAIAGVGGHMAMPRSKARRAAIGWAVFNVALAVLLVAYPAATIFSLLFFGAVYAAMFGAWQLATGLWLRGNTYYTFVRSRDLETRIRAALAAGAIGLPGRIDVSVNGRCAILTGDVNTWSEHQAAEHAALAVRGVARVDNRLTLLVVGTIAEDADARRAPAAPVRLS